MPSSRCTRYRSDFAPVSDGEIEDEATGRPARRLRRGEISLTTAAPLGFVERERPSTVDSGIIVAPRWVDLPTFPILEPSSSPLEQLHERARTGAGQEYVGVRDYRPGDPAKWVHWRSSARRDQLVVREFEHEVSTPVSILVTGVDSGEPRTRRSKRWCRRLPRWRCTRSPPVIRSSSSVPAGR